jgi:hypothetical protein
MRTRAAFRLCLALAATISASQTMADDRDEVILRSPDGSVSIVGDFVRVHEASIQVSTRDFGVLNIDATKVHCFGDACPTTQILPRPRPESLLAASE